MTKNNSPSNKVLYIFYMRCYIEITDKVMQFYLPFSLPLSFSHSIHNRQFTFYRLLTLEIHPHSTIMDS